MKFIRKKYSLEFERYHSENCLDYVAFETMASDVSFTNMMKGITISNCSYPCNETKVISR